MFNTARGPRSTARFSRKPSFLRPFPSLRVEELEDRATPTTFTWSGAGANDNWSTPANWVGNQAPSGAATQVDDLVFPAGPTQLTANNDLTGAQIDSITFSGTSQTGYTLSGNAITLGLPGVPGSGALVVAQLSVNNTLAINTALGASAGSDQFFTINNGGLLTITGQLSGTTGSTLTKEGTGTLVLSGDDSGFTGPVKVDNASGILEITNANALGSGANTTTVGTNSTLALSNVTGPVNESLILNGFGFGNAGALLNLAGTNTWAGPITLESGTAAVYMGANLGSVLSITGVVSNTGQSQNLNKEGTGEVQLNAANTYHGVTTVDDGILTVGNNLGLGATTAATSAPDPTEEVIVNSNLTGQGQLRLNDPTGNLTIINKILTLNGGGEAGLANAGSFTSISGNNEWAGPVIIGSPNPDGSNVTIGTGAAPGSLLISGVISSPVAPYSVTKVDTGELIFNNANTYTGATIVSAGTLDIRDSEALGTGGASVLNGATLQLDVEAGIPGAAQTSPQGRNLDDDSVTHDANKLLISNPLTLSGFGFNGVGALYSATGINIWQGGTLSSITLLASAAAPTAAIGVALDTRTGHPSSDSTYFTSDYSLTVSNVAGNGFGGITDAPPPQTPANLAKVGLGQLILPVNNTYTTITYVQQGWITAQANIAFGPFVNTLGSTVQAPVYVSTGAAVHLKALTPTSGSINIDKNISLQGVGPTDLNYSFINGKGALMSLGGANIWSGEILLDGTGGNPAGSGSGIGVELVPILVNGVETAPVSNSLTVTGTILDETTANQIVDGPNGDPSGMPGGLIKFGSEQLILDGSGTYTGATDVQQGILTVNNSTALGLSTTGTTTTQEVYNNTNTTIESGAVLQLGQSIADLNGGVSSGINVTNEHLSLNSPAQLIGVAGFLTPAPSSFTLTFQGETTSAIPIGASALQVQAALDALSVVQHGELQTITATSPGTAGAFTLTFKGQTTTILPYNATAAQVQTALNALSTIGGVGGSVIVSSAPSGSGLQFTISFGGTLANMSEPAITYTVLSITSAIQQNGSTTPLQQDTQTISDYLTDGAFAVTFNGQTTTLAYNSTAAQVQAALDKLSSIKALNMTVLVTQGAIPGGTQYTITFEGSASANTALPLINVTPVTVQTQYVSNNNATASNEQTIDVYLTNPASTYTLTYTDPTTQVTTTFAPFSATATAANIKAGLASLFGAQNLTVTQAALLPGGIAYTVTFGNGLAHINLGLLTLGTVTGNLMVVSQATVTTGLNGFSTVTEVPVAGATQYNIQFGGGLAGLNLTLPANLITATGTGGTSPTVTTTPTVDSVQIVASTLTFELSYNNGPSTPAIPITATAQQVQDALNNLPNFVAANGGNDVTVTRSDDVFTVILSDHATDIKALTATPQADQTTNHIAEVTVSGITTVDGNPSEASLVIVSQDDAWRGPMTLSAGTRIATDANTRLDLLGAVGDATNQVLTSIITAGSGSQATVESIQVYGSSGGFTLTFNGQTTPVLPYNATAFQVQDALDTLTSISGAGGFVTVTQSAIPSGSQYTVTFGDLLATTNILITGAGVPVTTTVVTAGSATLSAVQTLSVFQTSGTYNLTFNGQTTVAIPFNATAAQVQTALQNLSNIGPGNVTVTDRTTINGTVYTITFTGSLANTLEPQITVASNGSDLIKRGEGELLLDGADTYGGTTWIDAGIVTAGNSQAFGQVGRLQPDGSLIGGTVVANQAQLQLQGSLTIAGEQLTVEGTGVTNPSTLTDSWFNVGPATTDQSLAPGQLPTSGQITSVAVDPTDSDVIYISTAGGGAWKTINAGLTWTQLFDNTGDPNVVLYGGSIAVAATDPSIVYFATGNDNGPYDGISNQSQPGLPDQTPNIPVPATGDNFAGTGVYMSQNSGATWTLLTGPDAYNPLYGQGITQIIVDPLDAQRIYVASGNSTVQNANPNAVPGVYRYDGSMSNPTWVDITANASPARLSETGDYPPPMDAGPNDDYRIVFPQSDATWSSILLLKEGDAANAISSGNEDPNNGSVYVLYAALGDSQQQYAVTGNGVIEVQGIFNAVYRTEDPESVNPSWWLGTGSIFPQAQITTTTPSFNVIPPPTTPDGEGGGFPIGTVIAPTPYVDPGRNGWIKLSGVVNSYFNTFPVGYTNPVAGTSTLTPLFYGTVNMHITVYATIAYPALGNQDAPNGLVINYENGQLFDVESPGFDGGESRGWASVSAGLPSLLGSTPFGANSTNPYGNYIYDSTSGLASYDSALLVPDFDPGLANPANPTSNPMIVYLAGVTNLYESTNGGTSWSIVGAGSNGITPAIHYHALAVAKMSQASQQLYLATDGGLWEQQNSEFTDLNGDMSITQLYSADPYPTDPTQALAGAQDNGLQQLDGGPTWTGSLVPSELDAGDVAYNPTNPQIAYASIEGFLYETTDGGTMWTLIRAVTDPATVLGISAPLSSNLPALNQFPLIVGPADPSRILIGGYSLEESQDSGASFVNLNVPSYLKDEITGNPIPFNVNAIGAATFQGPFVADPSFPTVTDQGSSTVDDGTIYVTDGTRVEMTKDSGTTWVNRTPAVSSTDYLITFDNGTDGYLNYKDVNQIVVTQESAGVYTTVSDLVSGSPNAGVGIQELDVIGSNPGGTFTLQISGTFTDPYTGVQVSPTLTVGPLPVGISQFALQNAIDRALQASGTLIGDEVQDVLAVDTSATTAGTFTLTFGGQTTASINVGAPPAAVAAALNALTSIGPNGVVAKGDGNGGYLIEFSGPAFADMTEPLMTGTGSSANVTITEVQQGGPAGVTVQGSQGVIPTITNIAVDPSNRDIVYLTAKYENGQAGPTVFRSTNAGQTWTDITGNLPTVQTWTATVDPRTDTLYIGNDKGVWQLTNASTTPAFTWSTVGVGMPQVQVHELVLNETLNTLTAATFGRGLFQIFLTDYAANTGASIRTISGSSQWTGPVVLTGNTTIAANGTQKIQDGIAAASLEIIGVISDSTAGNNSTLTKTGLGTLILSGANTYGGQTLIQQGVLEVNNPQALGQATKTGNTIVSAGASLELESDLQAQAVTIYGDGIEFNEHNTGALRSVANDNTYTGQLTLGSNATIGVDSGSTLTIGANPTLYGNGNITDDGANYSLTKELTGTLVLASANTYGGPTFVNQGALRVEDDNALGSAGTTSGTSVLDGAQIQIARNAITLAPTVISEEPLILSGTGIFDTGALENVRGDLNPTGSNDNVWDGLITFDSLPNFGPLTNPGNIVGIGVADSGVPGVTDTLTIGSTIQQDTPTASYGLVKVGDGRLVLTTSNDFTGTTTIADGSLRIQNPDGLGSAADSNEVQTLQVVGTTASDTYQLTYNGQTTGNLSATASANTVQTALNGLPTIGQNDVQILAVSGTGTYSLTFDGQTTTPISAAGGAGAILAALNGLLSVRRSEAQAILVSGTVGRFTLSYNGSTTAPLLAGATAAQVGNALAALPGLAGFITGTGVTATSVVGGVLYTFSFGTAGLPNQNVSQITATPVTVLQTIAGNGTTDEQQSVDTFQTTATFTLTFNGQTTIPLAYGASPAAVQAALDGLSSIGGVAGNVTVTAGTVVGGTQYLITFGGTLGDQSLPLLSAAGTGGLVTAAATIQVNVALTVAGSATTNQQELVDTFPTAGSFTLTFEGQTTAPIAYGASAANVQTALAALSNIGTGNVIVTPGVVSGGTRYLVTFGGTLADQALPDLTATAVGGVATNTSNPQDGLGGSVTVTGTGPYTITFGGDLGDSDQPTITATTVTGTATATVTTHNNGSGVRVSETPNSNGLLLTITFQNDLSQANVPQITAVNVASNLAVNPATTQQGGTGILVVAGAALEVDGDPTNLGGGTGITLNKVLTVNGTGVSGSANVTAAPFTNVTATGTVYTVNFDGALGNTTIPTLSATGTGGATTAITSPTVEAINVSGTDGTFTLTFGGQTTTALAYNASAATVQAALNALSSVNGSGFVTVTVAGSPTDDSPPTSGGATYLVTFGGGLAATPQPQITANFVTASVVITTIGSLANDEVQTLNVAGTGGTYTLLFDGIKTSQIPYNETAANIQTDLSSLFGVGNVSVTGAFPTYTITFIGTLANTPLSNINTGYSSVETTTAPAGTQVVTVSGTAGTFTLTFNGETTPALPYNATAAQVQAALNALTGIGGTPAGALNNISGTNIYSGAVTLGSNASIGAGPLTTLTINTLQDPTPLQVPAPTFQKVGQGTVVFPNGNPYGGQSTVTDGVLQIQNSNALGVGRDEVQTVNTFGTGSTFTITYNGQTTGSLPYGSTDAAVQTALNNLTSVQPSETETVLITGASGTFTLTYNGQTTVAFNALASGAQVQAGLQALSNIGAGNVTVIRTGVSPAFTYTIDFSGGALKKQNLSQITATTTGLLTATTTPVRDGGFLGTVTVTSPTVQITGGIQYILTFGGDFADRNLPQATATSTGGYVTTGTTTDGNGGETQSIQVTGTNGAFFLTFNGQTTGPLVYNATASQVQTALNALSSIQHSEIQTITEGGTSGTYTLTFNGQTTASLAYNATAAQIQTALQGLSSIGAGNVLVTGTGPTFTVTFSGTLANQYLPQITALPSGGATATVATLQDGLAGSVFVTLAGTPIGPGGAVYTVLFQGDLATTNLPQITATTSGGTVVDPTTANDGPDGTVVAAGATLQLAAPITTMSPEVITINGQGFQNMGALNVDGANVTWNTNWLILGSNASIGTTLPTDTLVFTTPITDATPPNDTGVSNGYNLDLYGPGTVTFQANGNNQYTGTTTVHTGTLLLDESNGNAIMGPLVVGDGVSTTPALVQELANNQIADTAPVTVNSNGTFDLNAFSDTIGTLTVNNGSVYTDESANTGGNLTTGNVTMTGGQIVVGSSGSLTSGNVTMGVGAMLTAIAGIPGDPTTVSTLNLALSGASIVSIGDNSTLTDTGTVTATGGSAINFGNSDTWTATGPGSVTLTNSSVTAEDALTANIGSVTATGSAITLGDNDTLAVTGTISLTGSAIGLAASATGGETVSTTAAVSLMSASSISLGDNSSLTVGTTTPATLTLSGSSSLTFGNVGTLSTGAVSLTNSSVTAGDNLVATTGAVTSVASTITLGNTDEWTTTGAVSFTASTLTLGDNDTFAVGGTLSLTNSSIGLALGATGGEMVSATGGITLMNAGTLATASSIILGDNSTLSTPVTLTLTGGSSVTLGDTSTLTTGNESLTDSTISLGDSDTWTAGTVFLAGSTFTTGTGLTGPGPGTGPTGAVVGALTLTTDATNTGSTLTVGASGSLYTGDISLTDSSIGIEGSGLTAGVVYLQGNVTAASTAAGMSAINGPGTLDLNGADRTVTVTHGVGAQPTDLLITAVLKATGLETLIKAGAGLLELDNPAASPFPNLIDIEAGDVQVDTVTGPVGLEGSTATLSGTGTVGTIDNGSGSGAVGTVSPGVSTATDPAGILTSGTNANPVVDVWGANSNFSVYLANPSGTHPNPIPGMDYSQLDVNGSINISGATLIGIGGPGVQVGDQFVILTATDGVTGQFAGSGTIFVGGLKYTIDYSNPDEVVLTKVLATTSTTLTASVDPAQLLQPVVFTATVTPETGAGAIPATDTVTFTIDGGTAQQQVITVNVVPVGGSSSAATATLNTTALPGGFLAAGTHTVTAVFNGDTSNFQASPVATLSPPETVVAPTAGAASGSATHIASFGAAGYISPTSSPGVQDTFVITDTIGQVLSVTPTAPTTTINIYSNAGLTNLVRSFVPTAGPLSGTNYPISGIWDGKNTSGTVVPDGTYYVTVNYTDQYGNSITSAPITVVVDDTPPVAPPVASSNPVVSPAGVGSIPTTTQLTDTLTEVNLSSWTIAIYSGSTATGTPVRTFTGATDNVSAVWNGTNSANTNLPTGQYTIQLTADDLAGNQTISGTSTVYVFTKPIVTVTASSPVVYGQSVTLSSTVTVVPPLDNDLPGTQVTFYNNGTTPLGTGTLSLVNGVYQTTVIVPGTVFQAGTYPNITAMYDGSSILPTGTSPPTTLVVTPAPLTVTATNTTKQYGSAVPTLTYTVNGLENGDQAAAVLSGTLATTATQASPVIAAGYPITLGSLTSNSNYTIQTFVPGTLTVTQAPLTIQVNNATRYVYTANPTFTATFEGLLLGDTSAVVSGLTFTTTATINSPIGLYPITVSGTPTAQNYMITTVPATLSVTAVPTDFGVGSGAGSPAQAAIYAPDGSLLYNVPAADLAGYGTGGVRVAVADFNGDGVPDIVVGTGPGVTNEVRVINSQTGAIMFDTNPFSTFTGGVFVTTGYVNANHQANLIVTPDQGGGPRVVIFNNNFTPMVSYYGIQDTGFRGGARAAAGDINGDGYDDVVVAAGFEGGPRIAIWSGEALANLQFTELVGDFYAYPDVLRNGTFVAVGDVNGDGFGDLIVGAGPGGGPEVEVLSGATLLQQGALAALANPISTFYAGDPNNRGGVNVAAKSLSGGVNSDIVTGPGTGGGGQVTAYQGSAVAHNVANPLFAFDPFAGDLNGVYVG